MTKKTRPIDIKSSLPSKSELLRLAKNIPKRHWYQNDEVDKIQKQIDRLTQKLCNTPEMRKLKSKLKSGHREITNRVKKWNATRERLITTIQLEGPSAKSVSLVKKMILEEDK